MDVEEGEMGDDEAPTTWWVFRSSDFLDLQRYYRKDVLSSRVRM